MTENPRNAMVWATPYLKNEFIESYHFLPSVKVLKNLCVGSFLAQTSLRWLPRVITNVILVEHELENEI